MTQRGVTLPNVAFRPYTAGELAALDDLAPEVLVMLLYGPPIDRAHAQQLAPFLAKHRPRLLFRPYSGNIPTLNPEGWASRCATLLDAVKLDGELLPANEMNLAVEGGAEDWAAQVSWLRRFAFAWRKLSPALLHLPALSPSGDWRLGLAAYGAAKLDLLFDRIDVHAYGPEAPEVVRWVAKLLRGPLDLTEFNQVLPTALDAVAGLLESATWFLLGGTDDQKTYDLLRLPEYYQSFKGWRPTVPTSTFSVGPGVLALMATHGDHPVSDEHYLKDTHDVVFQSVTRGTKGEYRYDFQSNVTAFFPFG